MQNSTVYLALDLELAQPSNKIIELGICFGDLATEKILLKKSLYINPNEQLTKYITDLTGITQEQVDAGMTLRQAFDIMVADATALKAQTQGRVITWGHGDVGAVKAQLGDEEAGNQFFGRRYIDTKTIFQMWRLSQGQSMQGGLAKSLIKLGLNFEGRKHSGADDAVNTFRMFCMLLKKFRK